MSLGKFTPLEDLLRDVAGTPNAATGEDGQRGGGEKRRKGKGGEGERMRMSHGSVEKAVKGEEEKMMREGKGRDGASSRQ